MTAIDAVVFDNDGLLLDTEVAWTRAEVRLFADHGIEFTASHKRDMLGSSAAVAARKLERMLARPGEGRRLIDELYGLVLEELLQGVEPMPGAVALLDALAAAGIPVAVATNSRREFAGRALEVSGLRPRFGAVVSASDVAHAKPSPDVYLEAAAALGADPARCAGLEDSETGLAAVRAAGMLAIGVPSLTGVALADADLVVPSLADPAIYTALGIPGA